MGNGVTEPVGTLTQAAIEGNVIAILLLLALMAIVVTVVGTYLMWDKIQFKRAKRASGVPQHVVQTESTDQLAGAIRDFSSIFKQELRELRRLLDRQGGALADLASATNGLNHLQETWGAQMLERDDRAHDLRQALRMGQRDMDDKLKEIERKLSRGNGREP